MRVLEDMNKCYGCHACYNACPVKAISMQENEEGFLVPIINTAMCIQCGKCKKVCPVNNATYPNDNNPTIKAVMATDEIRTVSSSGGAFQLIADYVINLNGVVCGCALDKNFEAEHVIIEKKEELIRLQKSKYVQSRIGNTYSEIKAFLDNGRLVFFTGTPCQVAGLYTYLGQRVRPTNLITADLLCHGTPSPKAWRIYLSQFAGKPIKDIEFRTKKNGGWKPAYDMNIIYSDETEKIIVKEDCMYTKAFLSNNISRKSCSQCQFSRCPRQGDFSLGDFWGAKAYDSTLNDNMGTSIMFLNNEKAKKVFENIDKTDMIRSADVALDIVAKKNPHTYRFPKANPDRNSFMQALMKTNSFEEAQKAQKMQKYDLGIVSWFYALNYGAVLTSFAITKLITDLGYTSMLIDIPNQFWANSKHLRNPLLMSKRFIYKYCNVSSSFDLTSETDMGRLNRSCKAFAVASDQLWRWDKIKSAPDFFFLGFADENKKRFSFATSFGGKKFDCDDEEVLNNIKEHLKKFSGISVREKNGVTICKNTFGMNAQFVLDPVFLCNKEHYDKLAEHSKVKGKKFITAYMLSYSKEKEDTLKEIARIMQRELVLIPDAGKGKKAEWNMPMITDLEIEDFVYYMKYSDLVITDSFHAVCFSIIFGTPFVATTEGRAGKDRFTSLLEMTEMMDRLLPDFKQILNKREMLFDHPDFSYAHKKLYSESIKSINWLLSMLESK